MPRVTFRALTAWPYPNTVSRRDRPFNTPYSRTLKLLDRELEHLDASAIILAAQFREQDLRLDGMPRSGAREPVHPGVELSFDSRAHRGGRLVYHSDSCTKWEDNVRSIALGLEALRAVDRFGITTSGQQYAGWLQLSAVNDVQARGRKLIEQHGSIRAALAATHPDAPTGDEEDFLAVQAAR